MKKIILFGSLFIPLVSLAHVKWFAEPQKKMDSYRIADGPVIFSIIVVLAIIAVGVFLEKKLRVPERLNNYIEKWASGILSIASIGFGLAFLIFSYNGFIFAPNLLAVGQAGNSMLLLQAIAGAMILFGFYERIGGLLVVILFSLGIKEYGGVEMLDTLEMLGFAFYAMIIGRPKWKIKDTELLKKYTHHIHEYGLPILRAGTGLNLIVLGFTEKIFSPSLTDNFLSVYNWNFMQMLGFEAFSNYWFAFAAGVSEILFGVFFMLGLVTRITTLALTVFLVTTLYLLGPIELIGHLPHFSIAAVLLILGSGSRLIFVHKN